MNNTLILNLTLIILFFISIYYLYPKRRETFSEGVAGTTFVSRVPKGVITAFYPPDGNVNNIPPGWVICDGTNSTPDLRGRFILGSGQGSGLTNRNLKDIGGEENHKLSINEIPPHTHIYTTIYLGGGYSGGSDTHYNNPGSAITSNGSENNQLQGSAHNNMPPFYTLIFIMKT